VIHRTIAAPLVAVVPTLFQYFSHAKFDMNRPIRWLDRLCAFALAVALSYWFWSPLWSSGGFIGGDVYTYFLPQKQFLAESLPQSIWPLWHSRTSFGYPLVAESQTGVFYPTNWILYRWLDCNVAYHVSHLVHYILATLGMWRLAREWKLSQLSALLAALIYVYGWFPPRSCLEWAIIGGCYLPFALLLVERLVSRSSR